MIAADGGTGSGQTIAIVDAYNDPNIFTDAAAFNTQFGLPLFNNPGAPTLTVLNQTGGTSLPGADGTGDAEIEESLDVEWAHAIAPQANIILFEANSLLTFNLMAAVKTAAAYSGVSVVSMSWGGSEFSGETSYDSYFTTPSGHANVTFLAATGDSGAPGDYPAFSPNVVAVGGTSLYLNADNSYDYETAWSWNSTYNWGTGGGASTQEKEPSYQDSLPGQPFGGRETPDVSFVADPLTGVAVYDSYDESGMVGGRRHQPFDPVLGRPDRHRRPVARGRRS